MNFAVNELIQSIAGKPSLHDCSLNELQQLTSQYPYFGPAQFLLVRKMKEENSSLLKEYVGKVALYFQDSVWYHQLLDEPDDKPANGKGTTKDEPAGTWPPVAMEPPATYEEVVDQTEQHEFAESERQQAQPELLVEIPKLTFEPIDVSKAELTFEPYHTIDYFASQGIKPQEEGKPKDKFTLQLKSFTEWLKVMKKLPATEIASSVSASDEKKVEQMAELSINDREVVTETMAEVWERQGNHEKARETYEKLSLLEPAKSSYFAAKIEHLKIS
jgi:hypothetical protein